MEHAIGKPPGIRTGDVEGAALSALPRVNGIAFPRVLQLAVLFGVLHRADNDIRAVALSGGDLRPLARHALDVVCQHLGHVFHQGGVARLIDDGCLCQVNAAILLLPHRIHPEAKGHQQHDKPSRTCKTTENKTIINRSCNSCIILFLFHRTRLFSKQKQR